MPGFNHATHPPSDLEAKVELGRTVGVGPDPRYRKSSGSHRLLVDGAVDELDHLIGPLQVRLIVGDEHGGGTALHGEVAE